MITNRHILAIDFVIIVGTLISLFFVVGYVTPLVISPVNGYETTNSSVLFEFNNANLILLDDNPSFTSPQEIFAEDNLVINLKSGVYYWKVQGPLSSEVRKLTIVSGIALKVKSLGEDSYEVVNAGNNVLNVDIYENDELSGSVVLRVDEGKEVSGNKFVGGENEEN
ncbi:hypothetical protein AUJ84_04295 [Candidatus Pacearchaeota archaeon CG1_02_32_132]|nr:MAG: hypothetical protein AUJ84_04295 [Candidatus Pacearchaeota archaeon CG1_02_32_132]